MEYLIVPGLLVSIIALIGCSKSPVAAVLFVLSSTLINTWFIKPVSVLIVLNIYLHDVVFSLLLVCAFIRIFFLGKYIHVSPVWLIYGLLLFYGLFIGIKLNGTAAGVDFRNFFYYWAGTLYFMSFGYSKAMLDKIQTAWISLCTILLAIVYFRFVADFLHLPISSSWIGADTTGVRFRVIPAGTAYLLGAAVVMRFGKYIQAESKTDSKIITALFVLAVIVLQHRSVWAATLFAILSATLLPGIKNAKIMNTLSMLSIVGGLLLIPLFFFGYADVFINSIGQSAARATHLSEGTFGARVKGWIQIWNYWQSLPFFIELFGEPFGGGYAGQEVFPHNFYLQNLLKVGVLGFAVFLFIYISLLIKHYRNTLNTPQDRLYSALFFMLLVGQMAYYIPYGTDPEHGIILGIAFSLAKRRTFGNTSNDSAPTAHNPYLLNTPLNANFKPVKPQIFGA